MSSRRLSKMAYNINEATVTLTEYGKGDEYRI